MVGGPDGDDHCPNCDGAVVIMKGVVVVVGRKVNGHQVGWSS